MFWESRNYFGFFLLVIAQGACHARLFQSSQTSALQFNPHSEAGFTAPRLSQDCPLAVQYMVAYSGEHVRETTWRAKIQL